MIKRRHLTWNRNMKCAMGIQVICMPCCSMRNLSASG